MEPALDELVVPYLPNVLDSLALIRSAVAAAPAEMNAVQPSCVVLAWWLGHPPGPLAPVAAAQGCEGEGQGEADGEEGQHPLLLGPVHG